MSYVLFDDQFHAHPKVVDLFDGPCPGDAIGLYALTLSWVGDKLTDGRVSVGYVVKSGLQRKGADELVRVKLWHRADDLCEDCRKQYARDDVEKPASAEGYVIHGYLERNPSKRQVIAKREAAAKRKADWRNKGRDESTDYASQESHSGTDIVTGDVTSDERATESPQRPAGTDSTSHVPLPTSHSPLPIPTPHANVDCEGGASAPPRRARPKLAVPKDPLGDQVRHAAVWDLFRVAFFERYGVDPKRNGKVNGQISQFAKRIGESEWDAVIRTFVRSNNAYYVQRTHDFGCLLRDCESLFVQAQTGRTATAYDAHSQDKRDGRGQRINALIQRIDAEDKAKEKVIDVASQ